jgi:ATP synthase protein I
MADRNPPPEDRLSNLRRRVDAARERDRASSSRPADSPASLALRFGGEFGAAILVGALLGYGADIFLHSAPWGLVIGLAVGFVTGVVNVVRTAQAFNRAHPADPNAKSVPDDEDE